MKVERAEMSMFGIQHSVYTGLRGKEKREKRDGWSVEKGREGNTRALDI